MNLQINILVNEVSQSNDKVMSYSKIVFKKNPLHNNGSSWIQ